MVVSLRFCRISEFGSINKREFATRIVAKRQEVTHRNGTCSFRFFSAVEILASLRLRITCFSAVGILASLR